MEETAFEDLIPVRDPVVQRRHQREVFWQITVPLALGVAALLFVCTLTGVAAVQGTDTGHWRDMAIIWLAAPTLIVALIPVVLFGGLAYGVVRLIQVLPPLFYKVGRFFSLVSIRFTQISNRIAAPWIQWKGFQAGLKAIRDGNHD